MTDIFIIYYSIINVATFFAFAIDKTKARRGSFRISERMLLGMSLCGGSIGGIMGMQIFHHKTKHLHFNVGIPAMIVLHYILLLLFIYRELYL